MAFILAWFALTRLLALAIGVEPEPGSHEFFWQLLPFDLLEDRLAESLWYLHSQPPLYNAFVGALLDLPGDYAIWWRIVWITLGALFPLLVCASLIDAGAPRVAAHTVTLVVSLNPTYLLYENPLLYTYPEALCVLAGFWALLRTALGRPAWAALAAASSMLVLFRAMFQPVWSLGVAFAALTGLPRPGRAAYARETSPSSVKTRAFDSPPIR